MFDTLMRLAGFAGVVVILTAATLLVRAHRRLQREDALEAENTLVPERTWPDEYTCSGCGRAIPCRHCPQGTPTVEQASKKNKKDDWTIRVVPGALDGLDEEEQAHVLTEMATTLATGGIEELLANSHPIDDYPADGNCPQCQCPLVQDRDWPDEYVCTTVGCEACEQQVHFLADQEMLGALDAGLQAALDDAVARGEVCPQCHSDRKGALASCNDAWHLSDAAARGLED